MVEFCEKYPKNERLLLTFTVFLAVEYVSCISKMIKKNKIIAKFLYIAQELPYESWTMQTQVYEGEFLKKDHCLKLINEIWMTEKKYVEDLIVVCNLKAKFDSFQKSSNS